MWVHRLLDARRQFAVQQLWQSNVGVGQLPSLLAAHLAWLGGGQLFGDAAMEELTEWLKRASHSAG